MGAEEKHLHGVHEFCNERNRSVFCTDRVKPQGSKGEAHPAAGSDDASVGSEEVFFLNRRKRC